MKRKTNFVIAVMTALIITGSFTALAGEWDDESPITQDPVFQYRSYATVSPDGDTFVLYPDWTDWEDTKVMLMRSANNGKSWTEPHVLFEGSAFDNFDMVADENGLHLFIIRFHEDDEYEYKRLFYTCSKDRGKTFSTPVRIGTRDNIEALKAFSGDGGLYVYAQNWFFEEGRDYEINLIYASLDGGATWTEKDLLPGTTIANPDFEISGGAIHMVFGGILVTPEIRHCVSTDHGDTWSNPVAVSSGAGVHAQLPQIELDGGLIHVTWDDDRTDYYNVMYSQSADGGLTWSADVQLNDTYYGARSRLLADEDGLHVVWCQYHGPGWPRWGSYDYGIVWYKFSGDQGATWSSEFRVSQNEHIPVSEMPDKGANEAEIAEYDTGFGVLWQDKRDGNIDLYYRNNLFHPVTVEVSGPSWVQIGGVLDYDVVLENQTGYAMLMTRVTVDVSGPITAHLNPLFWGYYHTMPAGKIYSVSPSLPVPSWIPQGTYTLTIGAHAREIELDTDSIEIEVID